MREIKVLVERRVSVPGLKYLLLALSFISHLVAIGLVIYFAWPVAKWYLDKLPVRGVDVYLSASYVSHLLKNFAFRFNGWKEFWFSGVPYAKDYPSFYFYLMIPFAKYFGLIRGIQMFAMVGLFTFAAFSYLLYHELSKNRILAIILTLATIFSANFYRALIWAGGIPFWTTQALFPIVIFLIIKYCQTKNSKWFYLSALASGLGIMGHPQNFFNVILPSAFAILLFYRPAELAFSFKNRILDVVKLGGLSYLISLPLITQWLPIGNLVVVLTGLINTVISPLSKQTPASTGGSVAPESTLSDIEAWTRFQFQYVWSDTNKLLWYLLLLSFGLLVLSIILRRERLKAILYFIPFGAIVGLTIGSVFLYSRGIDFYVTGWYKAFWPVLVGTATLTAFLWGEAGGFFSEREFWQKRWARVLRWVGSIVVGLALIGVGYYFLQEASKETVRRLEELDNASSAYPEVLNVKVSEEDLRNFKDILRPKIMVDDSHDFRLYVIDATVNIWWGALEEMPLTRGYVDPPLSTEERWGIFWLDAVLGPTDTGPKSSMIEDWHTPEEVADNNTRFLLDWSATKYLEGNHGSTTNSHFASNITTDKFIETKEEIETRGGFINRYTSKESWSDESKQFLQFFRIKSDLVSPILMTTDTTPILHVGEENGFDTLIRFLGEVNLGPRKVILARGSKFIDDLSFSDLSNFDAIILYKYDYHNYDKAWRLIGQYIEKGGKVFIDTGPEVKESDTSKLSENFPSELPGIFPIKRTVRENTGKSWEPQAASVSATQGIDFSQFSPLIFDEGIWNVSHPISDDDLREDSRVLLRHKGIPVVVERTLGAGKVIWAGYNLPYHTIRDYNPEEAKFFKNLLIELVDLNEKPVLSKGSFKSPRERVIDVKDAKGVLFKEQAFDGWRANLGGRSLKIYKAGPATPGYMYVRLPKGVSGQVSFRYVGSLAAKLYSAVSILVILFILDYTFGGRILIKFVRRATAPFRKRLGKWWEKEDEY